MRTICLAISIVFAIGSQTEASTIVDIGSATYIVPQNGTLDLTGPILAPAQGSFDIISGPSFTGSGFAVLNMFASVNGANYSVVTGLGTCPVGFCGSFPYVTDTSGSHPGPGGHSTFLALNPELTISSGWSLSVFDGNISVPANYQVQVNLSLPAGVAAVPEPSSWAMLLLGFVGIGAMTYRRTRKRTRALTAA